MSLGLSRDEVKLVPHNPAWTVKYEEEKLHLLVVLDNDNLVDIQHIGSTSIPGIAAKPTIGILVRVKELSNIKSHLESLNSAGYVLREDQPDHLLFTKGPDDNQIMSLKITSKNSEYGEVALLFRDYLLAYPKAAKEYEQIKIELAKKYPKDRNKYKIGKDKFMKDVIRQARADKAKGKL